MFYFDTCFLTPIFLPETSSDSVESFIMSVPTGKLATSYWTLVEFASVLARRVRMETLAEAQALQLLKDFEEYLVNSYHVIMPTVDDFKLAAQLLEHHHTALDKGLVKAASSLNISAKFGIDVH